MAPEALAHVLRPLSNLFNQADYPDLLVGLGHPDDAAIYRLSDDQALVATVDFFTPIVDDPYAYGAIAAANSLSDVYAMGGRPLFALNIAAFPENLPVEMLSEVLRGGAEKAIEAGVAIAGGHTIQDKEPKYGLVVLGMVDPRRVLAKSGAQPGDRLILTKPLGAGVVTTAFMRDLTTDEQLAAATASMMQLNRAASEAALAAGAHAATDITGFGLLGHASEMLTTGETSEAVANRPSVSTSGSTVCPGCPARSSSATTGSIPAARTTTANTLARAFASTSASRKRCRCSASRPKPAAAC